MYCKEFVSSRLASAVKNFAVPPFMDGDVEMKLHCFSIFLLAGLIAFAGCDEDSEEPIPVIENGDVYGVITDKETGDPIENALMSIGDKTAATDVDGKYLLKEILLSDEINVVVTADDYEEHRDTISLDQELTSFDVELAPVDSPSDEVLKVLEALSKGIESLDSNEIPSIQSLFSEDYVAANDEATAFGVFAGVVPPNYDELPETLLTIIGKYDKLEFKFANPDVDFNGDSASVQMRFEVYAETKPPEPKKWEIVADGKLDLRKENGDWKITYWQLIPPFLKFEQKPL